MKIRKLFSLLYFLWILLATPSDAIAQVDSVFVGYHMDSTRVMVPSMRFGKSIYDISVSPTQDFMLITFGECDKNGIWEREGHVGGYEIKEGRLRWMKETNLSNTRFECTPYGVLMRTNNKTSLFQTLSGEEIWSNDYYTIYTNDSIDLALSYKSLTSSKLIATRLSTGEQLWENKLPHKYGWQDIVATDSIHRLIVADDICGVNIQTGEMKIHKAKTGKPDTQSILVQAIAGVAGGLIGGMIAGGTTSYYMPPLISPNVITGLCSSIVEADSCYYVADRDGVTCFNNQFDVVWEMDLADNLCSNSRLYVKDTCLYMINHGFGLRNGTQQIKNGRPFIATFDKRNGDLLDIVHLKAKRDIIESSFLVNDHAYLLFDDGLAYQALTDSEVNISTWDKKEYGKLESMLPYTLYAYNANEQIFLPISYDGINCPVLTDDSRVFIINERMQIREEYQADILYKPIYQHDDYLIVQGTGRRSKDCWFIHHLGMPLLHILPSVYDIALIENKLLLVSHNQILIVDIKDIIKG